MVVAAPVVAGCPVCGEHPTATELIQPAGRLAGGGNAPDIGCRVRTTSAAPLVVGFRRFVGPAVHGRAAFASRIGPVRSPADRACDLRAAAFRSNAARPVTLAGPPPAAVVQV